MKLKAVSLSIILLLIGGCNLENTLNPPVKRGIFMTDKDMSRHLIDNYQYFEEASKLSSECHSGDYDLVSDTEDLKSKLELLLITCDYWPLLSELRLVVYTESGSFNDYAKGYFYSESPEYKENVWSGNLNRISDNDSCHWFDRHIKVNDDELYENWYIFISVHCD
ncbi:MAG: hypothetical protein ACI8SR_000058 [Oceanicoccus sp.]|jgi:hypothetical protein